MTFERPGLVVPGEASGAEVEAEPGEASAAVEGEPETEAPAAPPPPPRLAEAARLVKVAQAKEEAAAAKEAAADARFAQLKEIGDRWGGDLELARSIVEAVRGGLHLKAARLAGIDPRALTEQLVRGGGDDLENDDRPLTLRELREQQAKEKAERAAEAERAAKEVAEKQAGARAGREASFLAALTAPPGSAAARLVAALGAPARATLLQVAHAQDAALLAEHGPGGYGLPELVAAVEVQAARRLAALTGQAAPAPAKKAAVVTSNKVASVKVPAKEPETQEERWARALKEVPGIGRVRLVRKRQAKASAVGRVRGVCVSGWGRSSAGDKGKITWQ